MSVRSAQYFMQVARWSEGKSAIIAHLPPEAIRLLSAPTTPAAIQEEVVEAIRAGADVDFKHVGERIRDERATILDARQKEERKQARLQGKSPEYQKRLARQMAREDAERKRRAHDRERRVEEARSILRKLPSEDLDRLREIVATERWLYLSELVEGLKPLDEVADCLAAEFGVSREQIIADGKFAERVDAVAASEGAEAARALRAGDTALLDDDADGAADDGDLLAWAKTVAGDELAAMVVRVPGYAKLSDPAEKIGRFLEGKPVTYHLRDAMRAVRSSAR
jgi:hypothetical protein